MYYLSFFRSESFLRHFICFSKRTTEDGQHPLLYLDGGIHPKAVNHVATSLRRKGKSEHTI